MIRQATICRATGLWLLAAVAAGLSWLLPPIAQPQGYHDFADQRACFGLPNCLDTASNALLVLAGAIGLNVLYRNRGKRFSATGVKPGLTGCSLSARF